MPLETRMRVLYDRLDAHAFPSASSHVWLTLRKPRSTSPKGSKTAILEQCGINVVTSNHVPDLQLPKMDEVTARSFFFSSSANTFRNLCHSP